MSARIFLNLFDFTDAIFLVAGDVSVGEMPVVNLRELPAQSLR